MLLQLALYDNSGAYIMGMAVIRTMAGTNDVPTCRGYFGPHSTTGVGRRRWVPVSSRFIRRFEPGGVEPRDVVTHKHAKACLAILSGPRLSSLCHHRTSNREKDSYLDEASPLVLRFRNSSRRPEMSHESLPRLTRARCGRAGDRRPGRLVALADTRAGSLSPRRKCTATTPRWQYKLKRQLLVPKSVETATRRPDLSASRL